MSSVVVEGLSVRYGDLVAVDNVSFTARPGEVTAVLGPNGAGKTSTIEVCEGFRRPSAGAVRVLGLEPTRDQAKLSERMGVMLQDGGVYPGARVGECVRQYCALYDRGMVADELVATVGLGDRVASTWRRLSGGERQRLSLALALAARPEVAFLDEPTAGVDVGGRDTIRSVVRGLANSGCAVVLATHELDEAERISDRVIIFANGRIAADAPLNELRRGHDEIRFRSDAHLDVAALSAAIAHSVQSAGPRGDGHSGDGPGGDRHGEFGSGVFVIRATADPALIARVAGWLSEHGHPMDDLRSGAQRLEDVFRRITGGDVG